MDLKAMDLAEVRNLVKWLDEQQRKGRQEFAVLKQQMESQQREMEDMSRRFQEMEQQNASFQAQLARLGQVDKLVENLRTELTHLVEQADERRIQSEKEADRLRMVDHQAQTRAMAEIRDEIKPIGRLVEEMERRKAEDERLSTALGTLQNQIPAMESRIDERVVDVTYLEEAQRQNARRIAEAQQGLLEQQKRIDTMQGKQTVLDDTTVRAEARVERLEQSDAERKQMAREFIEQGKLADQQRTQQLDRWAAKLEEFEELMQGYARQWRRFEEQHRLSKEATVDLNEFRKRLEQRQTEVAELQRVEDERMKQRWTEFLAEDEKRLKQRQLEMEQFAKEQKRERENYQETLQSLQARHEKASEDIRALYVLQEKYADTFRQLTRIWLEGYESVVTPPVTRKVPG
jgi:chromosome segregation ATPase